jgi:hypothetical protein
MLKVSNTSFNVNLLTTMQVSNSTNYGKKRIEDKQMSILINSLFTMHTSIECKIKKLKRSEFKVNDCNVYFNNEQNKPLGSKS